VNGAAHGVAFVVVRGSELWVEVEALVRAELRVPAGERETIDGRACVRLGSLSPAITYALDEAALTLTLNAAPELLGRHVLQMRTVRPTGLEYRRDTSGFVNYGLNWTSGVSRSASLEGGFRLGAAQLSTFVSYSDSAGAWRGPTNVTVDVRDRLERYVFGDVVGSTGPLGGAVQLAGASISRDYDLDPYFLRYPTVGLSGSLATPTSIDVYVNDRLVRREQLPPGTFTLNDLPVPVGAGSARVVMRDAFGREQEIGGSYYVTTSLLARGLQQFQYAVGAERIEPTLSTWSYGGPLLLAAHRVGLTDSLTIGGRLEAADSLASGGPQAVARIGRIGEVEGALAMSHGDRGTGHAWSASYMYVGRAFTVGGAWRSADNAYSTVTDLALSPLQPRLSLDAGVTVSTRLGSRVTATGTWQHQRYHGGRPRVDTSSVTGTYRLSSRSELYTTISNSRVGSEAGPGLFVGFSTGVGRRATAGASVEHVDGRTVVAADTQRSLPIGEGYGYRVRGEAGGPGTVDADLQYQSRFGRYEFRETHVDGEAGTSLSAYGAIVGIGGRLFASRPVEQSYALVRVPGVSNVRAYISHQEVGRTNRHGDLLVPSLLPYYGNQLSIAGEDVPLELTIGRDEMTLAPPRGGGALALFPVTREQRVAGRVQVLDHGTAIVPAYGQLVVTAGPQSFESPLGARGEFYLEGLPPGSYPATLESSSGACAFTLVVPPASAAVTQLGLVQCLAP
jgi:outer membrane usher protein